MELSPAEHALVQIIRAAFPLDPGATANPPVKVSDWSLVTSAAEENALAPLLYVSLKKSGRQNELPVYIRDRLRTDYLRSNVANWLAFEELDCLLRLFARERIPVVVLKGSALANWLYSDPALRPMEDIDLLIPPSCLAQASALLIQQGYSSPVELAEGFGEQFSNYRAFVRSGKRPAHLELHWHLFKSAYYCERVPIDWFWARTMEIRLSRQSARIFNLEAQLVHLCAHFSLHHRAERLIWSYDLALLLSRYGTELDWDQVLDAAKRFGLSQAMEKALSRVAETWQINLPANIPSCLEALRPSLDQKIAFAMLTARRGQARVVLDAFSTPGVWRQSAFWWRHIFPSADYMRARYQISDLRLLPLFYVWRLGDGAFKFGQSIASTVTGR